MLSWCLRVLAKCDWLLAVYGELFCPLCSFWQLPRCFPYRRPWSVPLMLSGCNDHQRLKVPDESHPRKAESQCPVLSVDSIAFLAHLKPFSEQICWYNNAVTPSGCVTPVTTSSPVCWPILAKVVTLYLPLGLCHSVMWAADYQNKERKSLLLSPVRFLFVLPMVSIMLNSSI